MQLHRSAGKEANAAPPHAAERVALAAPTLLLLHKYFRRHDGEFLIHNALLRGVVTLLLWPHRCVGSMHSARVALLDSNEIGADFVENVAAHDSGLQRVTTACPRYSPCG